MSGDLPDAEYQEATLKFMNLWLEEGLQINQRDMNYEQIGQTIDAIMGTDEPRVRSPKLSNARLNRIQKISLELRSMLTEIRPFWEYRTNSEKYEKQADIFGKLARHWYKARGMDQVFRDLIDYTLAAGSAYLHFFWNPDLPGPPGPDGLPTRGNIDVGVEDPRDVIPLRPSGDRRSAQSVRGWLIRRERPTDWLRRLNPEYKDQIKQDRIGYEKESPSSRRRREAQSVALQGSKGPHHDKIFGGEPERKSGNVGPVTDEFTAYLHDYSVNTTGRAKEMGPWKDAYDAQGQKIRVQGAYWSYIVEPDKPLYPFGRRIVFTRQCVIDDGPGRFHFGALGMHPICKMTLDTWAWSSIGTSPIQNLLPLQRAVDETMRAIQDSIRRAQRRMMIYDKNAVPGSVARRLNSRLPGNTLGFNPTASQKPVQFVDEPPLERSVPEFLQFLLDSMYEESGVAALKQLSQLNQVPSTETIDKILDAMTPLVRARSRSMEVFINEFAMMLASMFMQFYSVDLRLRILGKDGMTYEDWNYRPGDLMPDFNSATPDHVRNAEFMRYFEFEIAPGTLIDAATVTKKLLYLQLSRMGLVDHWTLCEVLGIPNIGKPPDWASTVTLRLQAERLLGLGIIASTAGRAPTAQAMPSMTSTGAISESG